jgi:hypothetical protein
MTRRAFFAIAAMLAACSDDALTVTADSGTDAAPRSGDFTAVTYNVAGLPEGLSGSNPAVNTQYISPLLNDYDLVLVQEDWLTPDPNPLGASLRVFHDVLSAEAQHPHRSVPAPCPVGANPLRTSALVSDGLNEFSRFAFRDLTRVAWEGCFGSLDTSDRGAADCMAMKGFSVAPHVFAAGVEIDVYTLHGEAGSTAEDQRLSQADFEQLATFVNDYSRGHAIIMGGDTNLHTEAGNPDAAIWQAFLLATKIIDVCAALDCGRDASMIDKFAFRSSESVRVTPLIHRFERDKFVRPTDQASLSDHDALMVKFQWEKL